ncbi:MAG: DUF2460 domain-containing protein [Alphaproteobacteria bacterium]|nr:DUF2460 domain-containing protein [Alphaproteobacteria bacterium]
MAFDEVRLPLRVAYGSQGGPQFMTEVVSIYGGYERRNQCWSQARRRFDARTGIVTAADASVLLSFFLARAGRARGFRLIDWGDHTSASDGRAEPTWADQIIGVGDGIKTQFQLVKTYGSGGVSFVRDIRKPVAGTVRFGVDDTEYTTSWSVDATTGVVTLSQAPDVGAVVKAGYSFDVPVRFDTDRLQVQADTHVVNEAEIPLIEVRV